MLAIFVCSICDKKISTQSFPKVVRLFTGSETVGFMFPFVLYFSELNFDEPVLPPAYTFHSYDTLSGITCIHWSRS